MVERSNKLEKEYDARAYADAQTDSEDKQRAVTATRESIEDVGSIGSGSAPDGESRILAMR